MASVYTTSFSHTYAGREILSEMFYKPQESGQLVFGQGYKYIQTPNKANLYLPNTLTNILKKYTTCGFSASGASTISDKVLEVERVKANLEQCEAEFDQTIFEEAMKAGVNLEDIRGTVVEEIALTQIKKGLASDIPRICWFADAAATNTNWDHFDGWFEIAMDATASLGAVLNMASTNTTAGTMETNGAMAADGAFNALKYLYVNQSKPFRELPNAEKVFFVTYSVWDNLLTTYETLGADAALMLRMDGKEQLSFRGIKLEVVPGWDTALADSTNPQYGQIGSNLIVLTTKANMAVGSDVTDPEAEFTVWHDLKDEKWYYKTKFKLGVQWLHLTLVHIAY